MTEKEYLARAYGRDRLSLLALAEEAGAKFDLETQSKAMRKAPCVCVRAGSITDEYLPYNRPIAPFGLDGFIADRDCTICAGTGYVVRANASPSAIRLIVDLRGIPESLHALRLEVAKMLRAEAEGEPAHIASKLNCIAEAFEAGLALEKLQTQGDVQCWKCRRWGWALDEFTSPYTGLCTDCSSSNKETGNVQSST